MFDAQKFRKETVAIKITTLKIRPVLDKSAIFLTVIIFNCHNKARHKTQEYVNEVIVRLIAMLETCYNTHEYVNEVIARLIAKLETCYNTH